MSTYTAPALESITPDMVESLAKTRPWVRFLSILGFVGTALAVVAGVIMIVVGAVGSATSSEMGGLSGVVLGCVYVIGSLLYLFPSLFLFRYASGIAAMAGDTVGGMERALAAQKSFWRFVGIATVIYLVVVVATVGILAGVAVFAALRGRS